MFRCAYVFDVILCGNTVRNVALDDIQGLVTPVYSFNRPYRRNKPVPEKVSAAQ